MSRNKKLHIKEYREELVRSEVRNWIAYQIRQLREDRGWSQEALGKRSGTGQSTLPGLRIRTTDA